MVKPRTQAYLERAERNRDLARDLRVAKLTTPSSDWAAVVTFYAALHFVHAYLYEQVTESERLSHKDREHYIATTPSLMSAEPFYDDLSDLSLKVRYNPRYRISGTTEQEAIDNLAEVERVVCKALGV